MASVSKHNMKNPAVKRIIQELKEMHENPSDDLISLPLQDNIFEWQFAIRGPSDTEFEGGIYHGRIQLPADYPFKPPSFMLLTPNGRFETQTKICLSISNYHPEHWQPSWSVRTALVALIAFMPTEPGGALGSLDHPLGERRALALKSRETPPKFGDPERQKLIDEIHQYMLSKAPPIPQLSPQRPVEHSADRETEALPFNRQNGNTEAHFQPENGNRIAEEVREVRWNGNAGPLRFRFRVRFTVRGRVNRNRRDSPSSRQEVRGSPFINDRILTYAAIGLTAAIILLLLRKFLKASRYGFHGTDNL